MLKFGMKLNGNERGICLVLGHDNLELLHQDRPMIIDLADICLGFVKRKRGRGKILIAASEDPHALIADLTRQLGIPKPASNQAVYGLVEVQPKALCYCALLGAQCVLCG